MITTHLAERLDHLLRAQGRPWAPEPGDRFVVPGHDLDDQVFVVSEMTIDVEDLPSGQLVRFNGTTEWALDTLPAARCCGCRGSTSSATCWVTTSGRCTATTTAGG